LALLSPRARRKKNQELVPELSLHPRTRICTRNRLQFQRAELALALEDGIKAQAKERQGTRTDLLETFPKSKTDDEPSLFQQPKPEQSVKPVVQHVPSTPIHTDKELAKVAGISDKQIQKARALQKAPEPVKEQLRKGIVPTTGTFNRIHP